MRCSRRSRRSRRRKFFTRDRRTTTASSSSPRSRAGATSSAAKMPVPTNGGRPVEGEPAGADPAVAGDVVDRHVRGAVAADRLQGRRGRPRRPRTAGRPSRRCRGSGGGGRVGSDAVLVEVVQVEQRQPGLLGEVGLARARGPGEQHQPWRSPAGGYRRRSDADRVPDGLGLEEGAAAGRGPGSAVQSVARPGRSTRLRLSAAATSQVGGVCRPARPARSIALTSMCEASHGRDLGGAPGEHVDDAARHVGGGQHLGQRDRRQRPLLAGDGTTHGVAGDDRRGDHRDQAEQRRSPAARARRPRRSARAPRSRSTARRPGWPSPATCGDLVRPAGVPDPAVDGRVHGGLGLAARRGPRRRATSSTNCAAAALQQLGDPVEHLAAVVRRRRRPAGERLARRDDRVAGVLAGAPAPRWRGTRPCCRSPRRTGRSRDAGTRRR